MATAPRQPMSTARYRALVAIALVVAAGALALAVRAAQTGDDEGAATVNRPEVVEHVWPREGDQVLRQTEIGVDLAPGYEGTLILNGQPIPEDELRLVPEQNQVFYQPGAGTTFEELPAGRSCAVVVAWRTAEGRGPGDRTFRWCFDAT